MNTHRPQPTGDWVIPTIRASPRVKWVDTSIYVESTSYVLLVRDVPRRLWRSEDGSLDHPLPTGAQHLVLCPTLSAFPVSHPLCF